MSHVPLLSVIICTSEGRAENLNFNLKMLKKQTFQNFEVLIVDDGSSDCEQTASKHREDLKIRYFHRENDRCLSRSRNLGAQQAYSNHFVIVDVDLMFNPHALEAYQRYLSDHPQIMVTGYTGLHYNYVAKSQFYPERLVNYLAPQFLIYNRQQVKGSKYLYRYPYSYASCNNFAIHRDVYEAVGGFNEAQIGWGPEDVEFCYRLINKGYQQHLSLETWAEHQIHERHTNFHTAHLNDGRNAHDPEHKKHSLNFVDKPLHYKLKIMGHSERTPLFLKQIFEYYLQHDVGIKPEIKQHYLHDRAQINIGMDGAALNNKYNNLEPYCTLKLSFFLLGLSDLGISFLAHVLQNHPNISPPPQKRVDLFTKPYLSYALYDYLELFKFQANKHLFDYSLACFDHPKAAKLMSQIYPDLKLVVLLREPIEQICSSWVNKHEPLLNHASFSTLNQSIREALKDSKTKEHQVKQQPIDLNRGLHYTHLQQYLKYFPREQILIVDFHQVQTQPEQVLIACFEFLKLKTPQKMQLPRIAAELPQDFIKHIDPELREALKNYYLESNTALQKELKLNFSWLNSD